jgi:N-acyl-D-aspartate/D-glutamate deacylase
MDEMKGLLDEALKEGAFGLSTGLNYPPGRNALTNEVIELAKVVSQHGGLYASHIRDEGDYLLEAVREFLKICEEGGVRGTVAHHKASGKGNYGKVCETLRMIDRARQRGVDVVIDQYPWRHGGTIKSMGAMLKGWEMGRDDVFQARAQLLERLKDPGEWEKLKGSYLQGIEEEREGYEGRRDELIRGLGWAPKPYALQDGGTVIYSKTHPELEGRSFEEVREAFAEEETLEALRALLIADDGWTCSGGEPYSEDDIVTILSYPWTTVSTDQYAFDNSKITIQEAADALSMQHPRGWGTYPKILGEYVREQGVLSLEEAIRKMTSLPARFMGLQDRGIIREGFWADIVAFDPNEVRSLATYGNPQAYPKGINYVLVNGEIAIEEGKHTNVRSGKALRNKGT